MTSLLIIVPARGGSKRLPGKNLKRLDGKSLLAHTADAIMASGLTAPVLLTTDDDAIAEEGKRVGWSVPFRRPPELASDTATTTDAVLHALDWSRKNSTLGKDPDAVMVLQPTSPLRGGQCLAEGFRIIDERPEVDAVIAMTEIAIPAGQLFHADARGVVTSIVPGDGRKPIYVPNGALYVIRARVLRREGNLYSGTIAPVVLDQAHAVDVDTDADWWLCEALSRAGDPPRNRSFAPQPAASGKVI